MHTISETLLTEAGYKCWKTEYHLKHWQKIFEDENGIMYFINIIQTTIRG